MKIRKAILKDIAQLVSLCAAHAAYEKCDFDESNKQQMLTEQLFSEANSIQCLVVENDQELLGYAVFLKQFSTWDTCFYVYLDCLFLDEKIRGQGIGKQLMQKVKDYAAEEKCSEIQWQTPDFNTRAIHFYNEIGAKSKTKERFFWEV